jgi:hypothetical protein
MTRVGFVECRTFERASPVAIEAGHGGGREEILANPERLGAEVDVFSVVRERFLVVAEHRRIGLERSSAFHEVDSWIDERMSHLG